MQVQQKKKTGKFACTMCGQKQSVRKVLFCHPSTTDALNVYHAAVRKSHQLPANSQGASIPQVQVYTSSGNAKDVRLMVQKLNLRRQEQEPNFGQEESEGPRRQEIFHAMEIEGPHSKQPSSSWQDFIEVGSSEAHVPCNYNALCQRKELFICQCAAEYK